MAQRQSPYTPDAFGGIVWPLINCVRRRRACVEMLPVLGRDRSLARLLLRADRLLLRAKKKQKPRFLSWLFLPGGENASGFLEIEVKKIESGG